MRIGVLVAAAALLLSACGESGKPPVLIEIIADRPLLQFSDEMNGQRVSVDGYIHIDNGLGGEGIALLYRLTSRPRGLGRRPCPVQGDPGDGGQSTGPARVGTAEPSASSRAETSSSST